MTPAFLISSYRGTQKVTEKVETSRLLSNEANYYLTMLICMIYNNGKMLYIKGEPNADAYRYTR